MRTAWIYIAVLILAFFSCGDDSLIIVPQGELPFHYRYEITLNCYCAVEPHEIEIKDGVIGIFDNELITPNNPLLPEQEWLALPNLLERVAAIRADNPFSETVELHPIYGFVQSCYFDIDELIADEEWGYTITNFEAL